MRQMIVMALVFGGVVFAQPLVVTQYQLTRMSPAPVQFTVIPKTAMTCGLVRGVPPSAGFRINDPLDDTRDCQLLGTANGVIVPAGQINDYRIMAATADGIWSAEHILSNVVPPASPTGGRVRPGASAQASAEGSVQGRFPLGSNDVASVLLDTYGLLVYFGAPSLTVPGYTVQAGDRFAVSFWR